MLLIESQFLLLQIPKKSLHLAEEEGHVLPQTCGVEERGVPNGTGNCTWRILQRGFSVLNAESATGWAPPVISWFINHYNPH